MDRMRSAAFTASSAAMAVLNGDGRILDVNPAFLAAAGRDRDELIGAAALDAGPGPGR